MPSHKSGQIETRPYDENDARVDAAAVSLMKAVAARNGKATADMYQADIEYMAQALLDVIDANTLPLAQALRLLRDTSSGSTSNIARRALEEAGIPDPEDDGVF